MPSGKHLSTTYLSQIWYARVVLKQDAATIFQNVFRNDSSFISEEYLRALCRRCDSGVHDDQFLGPKVPRSGGPNLVIDDMDMFVFLNVFSQNPQSTLKGARQFMCVNHYEANYGVPSIRTFGRVLARNNITRKILERVHYQRCPIKRAEFMRNAAPFDFWQFVDIDETLSTYKEFFQRYGYAPKGEVALKTQFQINGKQYSAIAAYSALGLLAYRVVEGSINSEIFQSFLEVEVADGLFPGMIGLFDNAAIHHTPMVRGTMEVVFEGYYLFVAPYSPDLKPVERLFAEIKDLLRYKEDEAVLHPIETVSECFDQFSPGMPKSFMAENHFRMYKDNHLRWLEEMAA
jgi:transposase